MLQSEKYLPIFFFLAIKASIACFPFERLFLTLLHRIYHPFCLTLVSNVLSVYGFLTTFFPGDIFILFKRKHHLFPRPDQNNTEMFV